MSFWLPPIWFGRRPAVETGGGGGTNFDFSDMASPVHTRVCEVLEEALRNETPPIPVWPDQSESPPEEDHLVVMNTGSEWQQSLNVRSRRTTNIRVFSYSQTSDRAERLIDMVATILRESDYLYIDRVDEPGGGRLENGEVYFRVFEAAVRN